MKLHNSFSFLCKKSNNISTELLPPPLTSNALEENKLRLIWEGILAEKRTVLRFRQALMVPGDNKGFVCPRAVAHRYF